MVAELDGRSHENRSYLWNVKRMEFKSLKAPLNDDIDSNDYDTDETNEDDDNDNDRKKKDDPDYKFGQKQQRSTLNISQLAFMQNALGYGQTGTVYACLHKNQRVATEMVDISKKKQLYHQLQKEMEKYEHLKRLQNLCIQMLVVHGILFCVHCHLFGYYVSL
ncbi:unnamed protein product [Didymodactylos carnosus]|uniref:Uncharacterized protein n=1 Tax=Didymodactylos carnosus TaxID=1234261 RepID=A0A814LK59_9BILA|nr:unnamed protein product [Didymodactylos carnosus]CAF1066155.1 unnamed protein product [Didymodactylos carnosus]CAF3815808.1 unnamed protein product [Didymodactylos carnosus]CAF3833878.1 unnamed protein product [Didymodactylos carnosus]